MNESVRDNGYERINDLSNNFQEFFNETKEEVKFKIFGYERNNLNAVLYNLFGCLFLGIPYLLYAIFPKVKILKYKRCSLQNASVLLVKDNHGEFSIIPVKIEIIRISAAGNGSIRYFFYQHTKYIWEVENKSFVTLDELVPALTVDEYLNDIHGLTKQGYEHGLSLYGPNKIEVEVKSYWTLFIEEVANPFYLFQAFSVILWLLDDYIPYAICVIVLTLFSSITSLVQTRKQSKALHDLVESSKCHEVTVLRQNSNSEASIFKCDPVELVPGDLIVLPRANYIMACDAVLLTGQCIVNESILTGESMPITKTALHSGTEHYNIDVHKRHTLFSGTLLIQTRYYGGEAVLARVVRTGFDTTKGALVKSILFPTPIGLTFYKDSFKFVLFLFVIAAVGMMYCLKLYISRHANIEDILVRSLDIITIVVPPALPAAMTVGIVYSQNRLKKLGIFCISPPRINVCGKIKITCFDKTGTLTHDGLDMNSVVPSINAQFLIPVDDVRQLNSESALVKAMATCHSLTRIDGKLNGDPLDLNMFEFTEWELEEPGENENARFDVLAPIIVKPAATGNVVVGIDNIAEPPYEIGIIRQFPFSSSLQCMSVICRDLRENHMVAFTKGAPEKLHIMCLPNTLPPDFNDRLCEYTARGYRVIAIAYKNLAGTFTWREAQKSKRDVVECDLIFLGFLIMQNPLKAETAPVIRTLHNANIRTVMITGDNILTAISVAHDCEMVKSNDQILILSVENTENPESIPALTLQRAATARQVEDVVINLDNDCYHFAIDGKTWSKLVQYYADFIPQLLVRATIFARFQPDQKAQLVTFFQSLDYVVSMVGDGANDCGALKAAHVGVSLSQAEASVAAPFTSSIQNISCIIHLILEGRCALVTSFATFKYMALYSLIQFFTVLLLYRQRSIMGDYQFLFIDLVITTSFAVTIGRQGPSDRLGLKRPLSSLVAAKNVIPLLLQIIACAFVQVSVLYYLFQQPWFVPISEKTIEPVIVSWENTALFTVSCYQYIILAVVYSKGKPYREILITNFWFLFSAISLTISITWLIIYPCKGVAEWLELKDIEEDEYEQSLFRYTLLIFPVAHLILAVIIEIGVAEQNWLKNLIHFLMRKRLPKNRYKRLLQESNYRPWLNFDNIKN